MHKESFSVWDAASLIVGIVVGTAIFKSPSLVFDNVRSPMWGMSLWFVGGLLSLIGAYCYAELATTYRKSGGDYHYISVAFGSFPAFLFGWAHLAVILTGSIGQMAYVFSDYAATIVDFPAAVASRWNVSGDSAKAMLGVAVIVALTAVNLAGTLTGKRIQNLLSVAKLLGLLGIIVAGIFADPDAATAPRPTTPAAQNLGLALVFVLYAYGGWNDAAFVAAEVKDPRRNVPRALFLGISGILILYLCVNLSMLRGLGFDGLRSSQTPAADLLATVFGARASQIISVLVMISALGAINGMILTGARVYARLGSDHTVFSWLSHWNPRLNCPTRSLMAQGIVASGFVLLVGTTFGRGFVDGCLRFMRIDGLPWDKYQGGFETLVAGTAPVFWGFFCLTGLALIALRITDPHTVRPIRVRLFPLPPLLFCATCAYMVYSSAAYARQLTIIGLLPLALGVPLFFLGRRSGKRSLTDS